MFRLWKCPEICRQKAISIEDLKVVINEDKCIGCGNCFRYCPNDAKDIKFEGFQLFMGGKAFNELTEGVPLEVSSEEVYDVLKKVLEFTKKNSKNSNERLSKIIKRIGSDEFIEHITS